MDDLLTIRPQLQRLGTVTERQWTTRGGDGRNRSRGRSPSWRRLETAQTREEAHLEQIVVVMPDRLRSLPLSAGGGGAADRPRFVLPFFLASRTSPPPPSSMAQERPKDPASLFDPHSQRLPFLLRRRRDPLDEGWS